MIRTSPKIEPDARMLIARLEAFRPTAGMADAAPQKHGAQPVLDLDELLGDGALAALGRFSDAQLDRLRRKIEVARKIYRIYEPDLSKPGSADPLSASGVNQLCALMLLVALRRGDARFLNSAFKLMDGILLPENVTIDDDLTALAYASLDVLVPLQRSPL